MKIMTKKDISKIAVLTGPGIGDVVTSVPLLRNLRKKFPDAEITVFNEISYGVGREILKDCPYVDNVMEINQHSVFSILGTIRKIRKNNFDIINDSFPSTWKTALFCYLSGAKVRMGYYHNSLSFLYNLKVEYRNQNKVELEAELLKKIGIKIDEKDKQLELFFDLNKNDKKISGLLRKSNVKSSYTVIGAHVGRTEDVVRTWADERWAELCDALIEKYKAKIVFVGSKKDSERTKNIISMMKNDSINLVGLLDLSETAILISKVKLFLCINGGPMHIAAALKKPLIALTGDAKPGWDPYGENSHVIRKCHENYRDTYYAKGDDRCMKLITVGDVLKKVKEVLKKR